MNQLLQHLCVRLLTQVIFLTWTKAFVQITIPAMQINRHHIKSRSNSIYAYEEAENEVVKRSVSDYMGGHHAGKYDFDTRISGVTALNYEKSVIFNDMETAGPILAEIESGDGELPSWATRTVELMSAADANESIHIGEDGGIVTIANEENTWESFYASVENKAGESQSAFSVTPCNGILAPRGGANNACDECRPYSDKWDLKLALSTNFNDMDYIAREEEFLVVRTECYHWVWRIRI